LRAERGGRERLRSVCVRKRLDERSRAARLVENHAHGRRRDHDRVLAAARRPHGRALPFGHTCRRARNARRRRAARSGRRFADAIVAEDAMSAFDPRKLLGPALWCALALPLSSTAQRLPDWSGWWTYASPMTDEWTRQPPPLKQGI